MYVCVYIYMYIIQLGKDNEMLYKGLFLFIKKLKLHLLIWCLCVGSRDLWDHCIHVEAKERDGLSLEEKAMRPGGDPLVGRRTESSWGSGG